MRFEGCPDAVPVPLSLGVPPSHPWDSGTLGTLWGISTPSLSLGQGHPWAPAFYAQKIPPTIAARGIRVVDLVCYFVEF